MDKEEYFEALQMLHFKLWIFERYLRRGDTSAEGLHKRYLDILKELLLMSKDYYDEGDEI